MTTRYQVRIKNTSGVQQALLTEWTRLSFTKTLNDLGGHSLTFDGDRDLASSIGLDYQVEVWRRVEPVLPWYLEYEGFHRGEIQQTTSRNLALFTSGGVSYDDLLRRRVILYPANSTGASKSGVGETVMKEYVNENVGPGAGSPPRSIASGITTGLAIEPDGATGATWEGERAYQNVLDVLREIAEATDVDFRIVGTGPATFRFEARARPFGLDRTVGNAGGLPPVVFAVDPGRANMQLPSYALDRSQEVTAAIALGQGIDADRVLVQRTNAGALAASPWNRAEIAKGAGDESDTAGLNAVGDALLQALRAQETFSFEPIQRRSILYGLDFFLGDIVTAQYKAITRSVQIIGVSINVAKKEQLSLRLKVMD